LELSQEVRANFIFQITSTNNNDVLQRWLVVMKDVDHPNVQALPSPAETTLLAGMKTTTITLDDQTAMALFRNELSAEIAYMRGKLKIEGNINAAIRLKAMVDFAVKYLQ